MCRRDVTFIEDVFPWQAKRIQDPSPIKIGDEFKNKAIENLPKEGDIFQKDPLSNNIPSNSSLEESTEQDLSVRRTGRAWKPTTAALESYVFCTLLGKDYLVFSADLNGEPKTYAEAVASDAKAQWEQAILKSLPTSRMVHWSHVNYHLVGKLYLSHGCSRSRRTLMEANDTRHE